MAEIAKMGITHEAILDWLILNPEKTRGECAEVFGVTESWLSTITNSDCFKARWLSRRQMLDVGVTKLAEMKLRGVVNKGLERLELLVETNPDPRFVLDTTDKMLARLGYGPKTAGAVAQQNVQNNYFISREVLTQARGQITEAGQAAGTLLEQQAIVSADSLPKDDEAEYAILDERTLEMKRDGTV